MEQRLVISSGQFMEYASYAAEVLADGSSLAISGRGKYLGRAVDVAMLVNERFFDNRLKVSAQVSTDALMVNGREHKVSKITLNLSL